MNDAEILDRLARIDAKFESLASRPAIQEWYTTEEFAQLVRKAEYTVREWCRLGRLSARKRRSGRGAHQQWVISQAELDCYREHGLLPRGTPT
jgi:hypothetical protein